jgi:hypothetical protein
MHDFSYSLFFDEYTSDIAFFVKYLVAGEINPSVNWKKKSSMKGVTENT